ncbi:DNA photolyase, FAD-binding/Cryptochrome [Melampsora americana]|nr:DNA photolyase, FAD-binding/Cryptochrome [Melampsora americana]
MSRMAKSVTIALFRNDLRVHDNPIIFHAHASTQKEVDNARIQRPSDYFLPIYVFDERMVELSGMPGYQREGSEARTGVCGFWRTGCHRLKFLCESVSELQKQLKQRGSDLVIRFGSVEKVTLSIIQALQDTDVKVDQIFINKEYASEEVETEVKIDEALKSLKVSVPLVFFHTRSLVHPEDLPFSPSKTPDVYTPFRKHIESLPEHKLCRPLLLPPDRLIGMPPLKEIAPQCGDSGSAYDNMKMDNILENLMKPVLGSPDFICPAFPKATSYAVDGRSAFPYKGGESEGLRRINDYFWTGQPAPVRSYKGTRNGLLGQSYSTKFSPFLAHGCLSPRKIIVELREHEKKFGANKDTYWVLFELLWRDYFVFITQKYGTALFKLGGFEGVLNPKAAFQKMHQWKPFQDLKMNHNQKRSQAINQAASRWLKAETGIPFLDANMVELRLTGFMSNRGRQNVASFLTKDLYVDWRIGAEFFESQLLDYDPSSNYGNWQYVAGVGNDPRASRQFNPIKQAKDYDAKGEYVRYWLPELAKVPQKSIHNPWLLTPKQWDDSVGQDQRRPQGYPHRPMLEQQAWKKHYQRP